MNRTAVLFSFLHHHHQNISPENQLLQFFVFPAAGRRPRLTHGGLCSTFHLGTSVPFDSLIDPNWIDFLFFHLLLPTSLSPFLLLSCPSSSSLFILLSFCFLRRWKRGRKCADECVWTQLPPRLCFHSHSFNLSVFWVWVRAGGPLMYTEKDPLSFTYVHYRCRGLLNDSFVKGKLSSGDIQD